MLCDRDISKCFDKDITEYLDKYHNKRINKYKDKLINKHENKRIDKYKTKSKSDFVARFCTLRESENTRPCENRTRFFFSDSLNVQKFVTQIIYLGPLPSDLSAAEAAACLPRQRRRGVRALGRHLHCVCLARTQHFRRQTPTFDPRLSSLDARRRGSGGAGGRQCSQNGAFLILRAIIM